MKAKVLGLLAAVALYGCETCSTEVVETPEAAPAVEMKQPEACATKSCCGAPVKKKHKKKKKAAKKVEKAEGEKKAEGGDKVEEKKADEGKKDEGEKKAA